MRPRNLFSREVPWQNAMLGVQGRRRCRENVTDDSRITKNSEKTEAPASVTWQPRGKEAEREMLLSETEASGV